MQRVLFGLGALMGLSAVAMASAAAHALDDLPAARLQMIRSALQMHGWHALASVGAALWLPRGGRWTAAAGCCFVAGTVVFCGSVYGLGLGWWHIAGAAPLGGVVLMAGWLLLARGAWAR